MGYGRRSRTGHTATLLAGGVAADGTPRDDTSVFDAATATVVPAVVPADDPAPPAVVETQPANGAEDVPPECGLRCGSRSR